MHDEAARVEDTDWPQILALYGLLERMSDNPMVALNHAIAAAMVHGPAAGLELLKPLDSRRAHERALPSRRGARASVSRWPATVERAIAHYRAAPERTASMPERDYLTGKAARLAARPTDSSKG